MTANHTTRNEDDDPVESLIARFRSEGIAASRIANPSDPRSHIIQIDAEQNRHSRDSIRAIALEAGLKSTRLESQPVGTRSEILIANLEGDPSLFPVVICFDAVSPEMHRVFSPASLSAGGFSIAISGGDGAGKSTAVAMLEKWLAPTLDVARFHFGRPHPLWVSSIAYRAFGIMRRLGIDVPMPMLVSEGGAAHFGTLPKLALAIQLLCLARDRREMHVRMRRSVGSGTIVLCDRYPDNRISDMDGPRLVQLWSSPTALQKKLIAFEERCYSNFTAPDLHVILRVSVPIALERQPKDDPDSLELRVKAIIRACEKPPPDVIVIDADDSMEAVHARIRELVWCSL